MQKPLAIVAGLFLLTAPAYAVDNVKLVSGTATGKILAMSASEVTVESIQGNKRTIPVNEIEGIQYEGESIQLKNARTAVAGGRYQDALDALDKIKDSDLQRRAEIQQDIQYFRAVATAKLALASQGTIGQAGQLLAAFIAEQPNNYRHLTACELLGDLWVASGQPEEAQRYYQELAGAPWPDFQMRAGVAQGRALMAQKKWAEAIRVFQEVLDKTDRSENAAKQRMAATLGKTRCLIEVGNPDEAVTVARGLIDTAEPNATELLAKAYNTLGLAYRKLGRPRDALMAFLHTEILYSASREEYREALGNLVELWKEVQKPDRAAQTQDQLNQLK